MLQKGLNLTWLISKFQRMNICEPVQTVISSIDSPFLRANARSLASPTTAGAGRRALAQMSYLSYREIRKTGQKGRRLKFYLRDDGAGGEGAASPSRTARRSGAAGNAMFGGETQKPLPPPPFPPLLPSSPKSRWQRDAVRHWLRDSQRRQALCVPQRQALQEVRRHQLPQPARVAGLVRLSAASSYPPGREPRPSPPHHPV